ncbi:helix-turn-helix domain-containing protein [Phocaeicola dorei]|nr:helix-turn-helix domain-containing protein [Phocaeicola dorei]
MKLQELVDQEKINYITAHLQKLPSLPQGVKEIKEKLGEYASYDEIRFVFEVYKKHIPT